MTVELANGYTRSQRTPEPAHDTFLFTHTDARGRLGAVRNTTRPRLPDPDSTPHATRLYKKICCQPAGAPRRRSRLLCGCLVVHAPGSRVQGRVRPLESCRVRFSRHVSFRFRFRFRFGRVRARSVAAVAGYMYGRLRLTTARWGGEGSWVAFRECRAGAVTREFLTVTSRGSVQRGARGGGRARDERMSVGRRPASNLSVRAHRSHQRAPAAVVVVLRRRASPPPRAASPRAPACRQPPSSGGWRCPGRQPSGCRPQSWP